MGARLKGAGLIIAVDSVPGRLEMARRLGADVALNFEAVDVVAEIRRLTQGRGVDVAIEALGSPATFSNGLKVLRPGGTLSSLGLYSHDLTIPPSDYVGGLGDQTDVYKRQRPPWSELSLGSTATGWTRSAAGA